MFTATSKQGCKSGAINVGDDERQISIAAGAALSLLGISGLSLARLVVIAAGGSLLYRGLTGHCALYQAMTDASERDQRHMNPRDEEMDMDRLATASVDHKESAPKPQPSAKAKNS